VAVSDLDVAALSAVLGDRPVRSYPALLSTEPDAMAWARAGAPAGALVVADYQASPRGRGGFPWYVVAGRGLGFSLVLRPTLPAEREGWPYVPVGLALADVLGADARIAWPDTVEAHDGTPLARIGVYADVAGDGVAWATVTVLVESVEPPRGELLARVVAAVEQRVEEDSGAVREAYRARCTTLARVVRARLIPLGPGGPEVTGEAVDVLADGALVLRTERGSRVAVPPQNLGLLAAPADPAAPPSDVLGHPLR
jgi:BirA family biotin operon repressor/biotin-[acetyl-CoA-carboxylase] ligase